MVALPVIMATETAVAGSPQQKPRFPARRKVAISAESVAKLADVPEHAGSWTCPVASSWELDEGAESEHHKLIGGDRSGVIQVILWDAIAAQHAASLMAAVDDRFNVQSIVRSVSGVCWEIICFLQRESRVISVP